MLGQISRLIKQLYVAILTIAVLKSFIRFKGIDALPVKIWLHVITLFLEKLVRPFPQYQVDQFQLEINTPVLLKMI